ncbi:hypothetical protein AVEN_204756-1 [Araneus ventricosus]|uniref:Uncharacterized protein n=1 Tax=Araneus ventricosus TaxID=182803 RepID=A0A4Y2FYP6_ARAVE|nr:hypothetical protein AVEN_204756-1 [Araneus ventricosus]
MILETYRNHLYLPLNSLEHLSDSLCDSLSAEVGTLMAITGHSLTPPVGGTYYHRQRATHKAGKRDPAYPGLLIHKLAASPSPSGTILKILLNYYFAYIDMFDKCD